MTFTTRSITTAAATAAFAACVLTAAPRAAAQAHVQESGEYVLRASTVSAENLPQAMREKYGISTDRNTAVLNITVQRKTGGAAHNVTARLEVSARNLAGLETSVDMREVVANDLVSYMGAYSFLPREVLDFRITAHPLENQQAITLEFRDRLGRL